MLHTNVRTLTLLAITITSSLMPVVGLPAIACRAHSWATAYIARHERVLAGEDAPHFLVSVENSGLADRIIGFVTQFWWAFISGRAIQLLEPEGEPHLSAAFDAPCIRVFTTDAVYPHELWSSLLALPSPSPHARPRRAHATVAQNRSSGLGQQQHQQHVGFNYYNNGAWIDHVSSEVDLRHGPGDIAGVPYLFLTGNRGRTSLLWASMHHGHELTAIAPARMAVAAAFNFLFVPNAATRTLMYPFLLALKPQPQQHSPPAPPDFWVGIHVRHSDRDAFALRVNFSIASSSGAGGGRNGNGGHAAYFDCARAVGAALAPPGARVRWLLVSDSLSLRQSAAAAFGDGVLTDTVAPALHIDKCGGRPTQLPRDKLLCNETVKAQAVQLAVRDILLLARANAHVISENSGFGRLAAFLSHAQDPHMALGTEGERCKLRPRSDPAFTHGWSGI